MKKNCNWKKKLALCLAIVMMFLLPVGCGKEKTPEDYLADMKEFSTPDGSASIYLDKNWETQDAGVDYWLCAGSGNGNERTVNAKTFEKVDLRLFVLVSKSRDFCIPLTECS